MAIDANAAVIIATHPSLTGITSGSGLSGNTVWHKQRSCSRLHEKCEERRRHRSWRERARLVRIHEVELTGRLPTPSPCAGRMVSSCPESMRGSLVKLASEAKSDKSFLRVAVGTLQQRGSRCWRAARAIHMRRPCSTKNERPKPPDSNEKNLADATRHLFASKKIHIEEIRLAVFVGLKAGAACPTI